MNPVLQSRASLAVVGFAGNELERSFYGLLPIDRDTESDVYLPTRLNLQSEF